MTTMPQPLPSLDGVPIFGYDLQVTSVVELRARSLPMIAAAKSPAERAKGLLLYTNMSARCVDAIKAVLPEVKALPRRSPGRQAAEAWLAEAFRIMEDVNGPDGFSAEQQAILKSLGDAETERIAQETNELLRQLVDEVLPTPSELVSPSAHSEKTCPDCAETVKDAARVCKHCGYRFS